MPDISSAFLRQMQYYTFKVPLLTSVVHCPFFKDCGMIEVFSH